MRSIGSGTPRMMIMPICCSPIAVRHHAAALLSWILHQGAALLSWILHQGAAWKKAKPNTAVRERRTDVRVWHGAVCDPRRVPLGR